MTALEIVQAKYLDSDTSEFEFVLALDEVAQVIKNYCNIEEVPEGLKYTWANMAVDLLKYNSADKKERLGLDSFEPSEGDVSSIKLGDTQIALQGGNPSSSHAAARRSHSLNLDQITLNYKEQLNRFRKMVW